MKSKLKYPVIAVCLAVVAAGCKTGDQAVTEERSNPAMTDQASRENAASPAAQPGALNPTAVTQNPVIPPDAGKPGPDEQSGFIAEMESKLKDMDAKINALAQKVDGYKDEARNRAVMALAELHEQRDKAKAKLDEARDAGSEGWKGLKGGVEVAMKDLGDAYENARAKFD